MKKLFLSFAVLAFAALCAFADGKNAAVKDLSDKNFLHEVARYLYRWYLDEPDIVAEKNVNALKFQVRHLDLKLDRGDKSLFGEIRIPLWNVCVKLKKADYRIEELGKTVRSNGFKIVNVARISAHAETPKDLVDVHLDMNEMKEYLFKTRNKQEYPSNELVARIRKAFREEFDELRKRRGDKIDFSTDADEILIYMAPLSPVSNEIWAYRETGHILIRCSSDIDISNSAVWENEKLFFNIYDVLNLVVVSFEESAGSNQFMTRTQVGRSLYNCIVLGKKITIKRELTK